MKKVEKRRVKRKDNENEDDKDHDRRKGIVKTVRPCAAGTWCTEPPPFSADYSIKTGSDAMRRLASRVFPVLKSIGLICAICFPPAAFAQVRYHITRIPTAQGANSVALGINNKGEVVGYSFRGEDYQAFVYSSSDQKLTDHNLRIDLLAIVDQP